MRLSACIETLFAPETASLPERIRLAASAGVEAVEFWTWRDKDLDAVEEALGDTGLAVAAFSAEPRTRLVDPDAHEVFLEGLEASVEVARRLGSPRLIVLSGDEIAGRSREQQREALLGALEAASRIAEWAGVTLCLEPLNTKRDHRGCFLDSTAEGLDIVRSLGRPHIKLLYDLYHSMVMDEEPEEVLEGAIDQVAHVHIADAPGRGEPGTGAIDWARRFAWLRDSGFEGFVGLEYVPSKDSAATIAEVRQLITEA